MSIATGTVKPSRATLDYTTSEAGNPFVEGWYVDPGSAVYDGAFWVYATSSCAPEDQTQIDAFSSPDLIHWTKHPGVLKTADVSWAKDTLRAPTPISRNGKYYLYFSANDLQKGHTSSVGGIGVAVANKPEGPFADAIGTPLIGSYHNGVQPVDQDVFIDDADGKAYIYYGGNARANIAVLSEDMVSLRTFDDGTTHKEITPKNYSYGPKMVKRNDTYYFMWSEGSRDSPDSSISYAIADNPLGPFERRGKILQPDSAIAKGIGHNSVIHVPDTDIWYILYHRLPLRSAHNNNNKNHRILAYDRMYFNNTDATINPITMLVKDNFADGAMLAWTPYGGSWRVENARLTAASSSSDTSGMALLDTNFADLVFDATIATTSGAGHPGLLFRVTDLSSTTHAYRGYKAAISPSGVITLGKADRGTFTDLAQAKMEIAVGTEYRVRVTAVGSEICVFVGDWERPRIRVFDGSFMTGANGVRVFNAAATFGDVVVARPEVDGNGDDGDDLSSACWSWDDKSPTRSGSDGLRKGAESEARLPRFSLERLFCGIGRFF